jgi:hypothetical protein
MDQYGKNVVNAGLRLLTQNELLWMADGSEFETKGGWFTRFHKEPELIPRGEEQQPEQLQVRTEEKAVCWLGLSCLCIVTRIITAGQEWS